VDAGLPKDLLELVKLRASQINGCAFCTQLHLNVARGLGVPAEKLDLCAMWREAGVLRRAKRPRWPGPRR
jgi:AhpD family alkylhydroperoxidase